MERNRVVLEVHNIRGHCPVYKKGDKLIIDPIPNEDVSKVNLKETDALCTHALPSILHYVLILENHWNPFQLGLTKKDDQDNAYIQCLDPGQPYTEGGTVIFRIRKIK